MNSRIKKRNAIIGGVQGIYLFLASLGIAISAMLLAQWMIQGAI